MHAVIAWIALLQAVPEPDPELWHLRRFPPREAVQACLALNREYRDRLQDALYLDPRAAEEAQAATDEASWLYRAWDDLDSAQHDDWDEGTRREALGRLRERLGWWNFWQGRLPAPLPVQRLRRLD